MASRAPTATSKPWRWRPFKNRNPNSAIAVKDLQTGVITPVLYKPV
jgi:hypothetical protein